MAEVKVKIRIEVDGQEVTRTKVKGDVNGREDAQKLTNAALAELTSSSRRLTNRHFG